MSLLREASNPAPAFDPHRNGGFDPQPDVARLTHADSARTLAGRSGRATLSTISREPHGYPFGSLITYQVDDAGAPWVIISTMAEHTQNALIDPRASLMISEEAPPGADPLALARVSLVGVLGQATPTPALAAPHIFSTNRCRASPHGRRGKREFLQQCRQSSFVAPSSSGEHSTGLT